MTWWGGCLPNPSEGLPAAWRGPALQDHQEQTGCVSRGFCSSKFPLRLASVALASTRESLPRERAGAGQERAGSCRSYRLSTCPHQGQGEKARGTGRSAPVAPTLAGLGNPIPEPPGLAAPPALLVTVRGAEPQGC